MYIKIPTQVVHSHELLGTPIFLRFLNMIINDATVQLDEGLEVWSGCYGCSKYSNNIHVYTNMCIIIKSL